MSLEKGHWLNKPCFLTGEADDNTETRNLDIFYGTIMNPAVMLARETNGESGADFGAVA